MHGFSLTGGGRPVRRVLCLGAHSDDVEIGCGGTLMRLAEECPDLSVYWVVFGAREQRALEARRSADVLTAPLAERHVEVKGFRDSFFPYIGGEIKEYFEQLKGAFNPDLILTHCRHDLHQDHRLVCELTWNTFRDHLILEYEIPKYDGDLGSPNFFVHLSEEVCRRKARHIVDQFATQRGQHWFTEDVFLATLRLRGVESNSPSGYAEAFYCRKATV